MFLVHTIIRIGSDSLATFFQCLELILLICDLRNLAIWSQQQKEFVPSQNNNSDKKKKEGKMCYVYSTLVYFPHQTDYLNDFFQHGLKRLSEGLTLSRGL